MRRPERLRIDLPIIGLDWAALADGDSIGGPTFRCPVGGCGRFRRICGRTPPRVGDAVLWCPHREARIAALRRFADQAAVWREEE